jgi:hypothetical protein
MNTKLWRGHKIAEFDICSWNETKTVHETAKDVLLTFHKFPVALTLLSQSEYCELRQQEGKRQQLSRIRLLKRLWHFTD